MSVTHSSARRRSVLRGAGLALALGAVLAVAAKPMTARADERVWHHGMSLIGSIKYPADFKHFDWVNPDAPKGGAVRMMGIGTFDTLNDMPVRGNPALGLTLLYGTLMSDSLDEPSTSYGLIAEAASYPDDYSSVTFRLRKEARFHDGTPITPEDVIFSFLKAKEIDPRRARYYENVTKAEKTADNEVTFTFDVKNNRELPFICGQIVVLPKHWWEGKDAKGNPRDLSRGTLEPPLGSGPYRIAKVNSGRSITYERVQDYWAKDLPVMKGIHNLDTIRFDYYKDQLVAFEGFKAGQTDFFQESSAKQWATQYEFPALKSGLVVKRKIDLKTPEGMQAFVLNLRRPMFKDARVREAFNLAFNFEYANKNLFYGQYTRTDSFFENSELASSGLPEGRELEILNEVKSEVPPEVFTTPYANPVSETAQQLRENLKRAAQLLKDAGWTITGGKLVDASGAPFRVEFLFEDNPLWERITLPYIDNLKRLGVQATIRNVDDSQYIARRDEFDFDIIIQTLPQSDSPGNEQRYFFGSGSADQPGSYNFIGIKNPAVDKLIDKIIFAKDRADLVAATRALDRVLLWNHYVVPQWHIAYDRVAYWDQYRRPEPGPSQSNGFPNIWWFDAEAAKALAARKKQ